MELSQFQPRGFLHETLAETNPKTECSRWFYNWFQTIFEFHARFQSISGGWSRIRMVFSQKGAQKSNVGNSSFSAVRSSFLSITAEERGLCLASRFFLDGVGWIFDWEIDWGIVSPAFRVSYFYRARLAMALCTSTISSRRINIGKSNNTLMCKTHKQNRQTPRFWASFGGVEKGWRAYTQG